MRASMIVLGLLLASCAAVPPPAQPQPLYATPQPGSIAWQLSRPWRHVGSPVSDQQFILDKNKCAVTARMAPVGKASPGLVFDVVWIECMRAAGYEPTP